MLSGLSPGHRPRHAGQLARRCSFRLAPALSWLAAALTPTPTLAQDADSTPPRKPPVITRADVGLAAGLSAATLLLLPADVELTRRLRSPDVQRSRPWRVGAVVFDRYGAPGAQVAGPSLFLAGRLGGSAGLTDAGIHVTESYAAAAVVVLTVKGIAGRARPYTVSGEQATDFKLGRGYPHREPYSSFPSGHATGSFAFAAAITEEAKHWWPRRARLIGTLAYGSAFLDGVSRVYRDMHWPSDVAAGALVGTLTGTLVTRHQHANPDNLIDRLARKVTFVPAPDGRMRVSLTGTF
jgi:undecaprenyl-diphosphatase